MSTKPAALHPPVACADPTWQLYYRCRAMVYANPKHEIPEHIRKLRQANYKHKHKLGKANYKHKHKLGKANYKHNHKLRRSNAARRR